MSLQDGASAADDLDQFFALSHDLFCIAGFNGHFRRVNSAWERALGLTSDELMARTFLELVHPDDRESVAERMAELSAGAASVSFDARFIHQDGSLRRLQWEATAAPSLPVFYAVVRERAMTRKSDEEIYRSQIFLNSIVENVPNMIFVKDAQDLKFVLFNKAGEDLLGFGREDLIGKNDYELFPLMKPIFSPPKTGACWSGGN